MKIFCFALALAAIAVFAFFYQQHAPAIIDWIDSLGLLAPVFFLLLYCMATIFLLPTMVLTLAGGALFGPVVGTLFNWVGASLGAACAFCISRYLVFDRMASMKNARLNKLIKGVENQGWKFVALARLVPIIPFNLVNYGLGVTRIKLSHYLIATTIFLIPAEIVFTYCGYAGMDILIHPKGFYKNTGLILLPCSGALLFVYILLKRRYSRVSKKIYCTPTNTD